MSNLSFSDIHLTNIDITEFNKCHYSYNRTRRRVRIFFLLFILLLYIYSITIDHNLTFISYVGFMLLVIQELIPFTFKIFVNMAYENDHVLQDDYTFVLDEDGITIGTKRMKMLIQWLSIYRICINKQYFIFYINSKKAFILPRRYLTKDETERIMNTLVTHLPNERLEAF